MEFDREQVCVIESLEVLYRQEQAAEELTEVIGQLIQRTEAHLDALVAGLDGPHLVDQIRAAAIAERNVCSVSEAPEWLRRPALARSA